MTTTTTHTPPRSLGALLIVLGFLLCGLGLLGARVGLRLDFLLQGLGILLSGVLVAFGLRAGVVLYFATQAVVFVWAGLAFGVGDAFARVMLPTLIGLLMLLPRTWGRLRWSLVEARDRRWQPAAVRPEYGPYRGDGPGIEDAAAHYAWQRPGPGGSAPPAEQGGAGPWAPFQPPSTGFPPPRAAGRPALSFGDRSTLALAAVVVSIVAVVAGAVGGLSLYVRAERASKLAEARRLLLDQPDFQAEWMGEGVDCTMAGTVIQTAAGRYEEYLIATTASNGERTYTKQNPVALLMKPGQTPAILARELKRYWFVDDARLKQVVGLRTAMNRLLEAPGIRVEPMGTARIAGVDTLVFVFEEDGKPQNRASVYVAPELRNLIVKLDMSWEEEGVPKSARFSLSKVTFEVDTSRLDVPADYTLVDPRAPQPPPGEEPRAVGAPVPGAGGEPFGEPVALQPEWQSPPHDKRTTAPAEAGSPGNYGMSVE